jgi:predicted negative regulator of RcsB-dependent stress response
MDAALKKCRTGVLPARLRTAAPVGEKNMAKTTSKRRVALDTPEGLMEWGLLGWERVRPYVKWLVLGVVVIAVGVGAWLVNTRMQTSRDEAAAAALARVTPKIDLNIPAVTAATDLGKFIKKYPGTPAAREAQLMRADLLYKLESYSEAAQAYKSLLDSSDPTWNALITESLSYCYEGMGKYKKAAEVLKSALAQIYGPLKTEVIYRLAMLYEQAKAPKEAAIYWRKLLEKPENATMEAYIQGKLAAAQKSGADYH